MPPTGLADGFGRGSALRRAPIHPKGVGPRLRERIRRPCASPGAGNARSGQMELQANAIRQKPQIATNRRHTLKLTHLLTALMLTLTLGAHLSTGSRREFRHP